LICEKLHQEKVDNSRSIRCFEIMPRPSKNVLITGLPGSGKTTFIKKLVDELREYHPAGFYTGEIRSHGVRRGFQLLSLVHGTTRVLADVDIAGPHRVGKYGVDLQGFERFLGTLPLLDRSTRLVIVDEIGRMECLSAKFRELVTSLLDAPAPVIATIALKGGGFIDEVKRRPDIRLYELTEENRDGLLSDISGAVRLLIDS
jgi:nucleoside-triphosphatase